MDVLLTLLSSVRFTCGFIKDSNGIFPVDRIEGLQRGRIFKDLTCAASRDVPPPISTLSQMGALHQPGSASYGSSDRTVSKYLYADGRLALQLTPAPGEWVASIIVHDFHAQKRWDLSLPSMRTRGVKLALWALGLDLVVARVVGERVMCVQNTRMVSHPANYSIRYAWDLRSHVFDRVVLSSIPYRCFTKHRSVVIVTNSGKLLFWSFGGDLVDIDMTTPQDEGDYRGPAEPECIPRAPLSAYERQNLRIMFHPGDEDVFFMATFDDRVLEPDVFLLLWVYEFRNKRCCRIFTYSVPPERRHWIVFGAHEVDAHGTYQLLEQEYRTEDGVHVNCVTFNTISKSFGNLRFQVPLSADQDMPFVWNDHLVLGQASPVESRVRPCPLVALGRSPDPHGLGEGSDIVFESGTYEVAMEDMMKSVMSPKYFSRDTLRAAMKASEHGDPKYDIVRAQDVSPSTSFIGASIGLRYMLSFIGGYCNWEGLHVNGCPRSSGLQSSDGHLYPLNFAEDTFTNTWGGTAKAILGDDNFLVVINSRDYYTVFAVDEDGKMAEAMRDGASHNAAMSREAPQVTGS